MVFDELGISVAFIKMITSILMMIFLLHLFGCLWGIVASLTYGDAEHTWITLADLTTLEPFE